MKTKLFTVFLLLTGLWSTANAQWSRVFSTSNASNYNCPKELISFKGNMYMTTTNSGVAGLYKSATGNFGDWSLVLNTGNNYTGITSITTTDDAGGRMFIAVAAENSYNGFVLSTTDGVSWDTISTPGFGDSGNEDIYHLFTFKGNGGVDSLYACIKNWSTGLSIWRTSVDNTNDTNWTKVLNIQEIDTIGGGSIYNYYSEDVAVFNGRIYLIAGGSFERLYSSANGYQWIRETSVPDNFGLSSNSWFSALEVYNNELYLAQHGDYSGAILYKTADLVNWTTITSNGFGLEADNYFDITDMHVANGKLYVAINGNSCGSGGWGRFRTPQTEQPIAGMGCQDQSALVVSEDGVNFTTDHLLVSSNSSMPARQPSTTNNTYYHGSIGDVFSANGYVYFATWDNNNSGGRDVFRKCFSAPVGDPVLFSSPHAICEGSTYTFDASSTGAVSYQWLRGTDSTLISTADHVVLDSTNRVLLEYINNDGCIFNTEATLFVNPFPPHPILGFHDTTTCQGNQINLSVEDTTYFLGGLNFFYSYYSLYSRVNTPPIQYYFVNNNFSQTFEFFIKPTDAGVVLSEEFAENSGWHTSFLEIGTMGEVYARVWNLPAKNFGSLNMNQWNHIALRYNAPDSLLNVFINGVKSDTITQIKRQSALIDGGTDAFYRFGGRQENNMIGQYGFRGDMHDIRIWDYAVPDSILSQQILTIKDSMPGLVINYPLKNLLDIYSSVATDVSGHHLDGSNSNTAYLQRPYSTTYDFTPKAGVYTVNQNLYTLSPIRTTKYVISSTNDNVCYRYDSVTVHIPGTALNLRDTGACVGANGTFNLSVTGYNNPIWTPSAGLNDTIGPNVIASPLVTTTYSVIDTIGACLFIDTVRINVYPKPFVSAGGNFTTCEHTTIHLEGSASGDVNYWLSNGVIQDSTNVGNGNFVASNDIQVILFSKFNQTGCSLTDTATITVIPGPTVDLGSDVNACHGDTIHLTGTISDSTTFYWGHNEPTFTNGNTLTPYFIASAGRGGMIVLSVTDTTSGCSFADTLFPMVHYPIQVAITQNDTSICEGVKLSLNATNADAYSWYPAAGLSDTLSSYIDASPSISTTYYVVGKDSNYCYSKDSITLFVNSLPVITTAGDTNYCYTGTPVGLSCTANGDLSYWIGSDHTLSDTLSFNPTVNPLGAQYYIFKSVFTYTGCAVTDSVYVTAYEPNTVVLAEDTAILCHGVPYTIGIYGGDNLLWNSNPGIVLATPTGLNINPRGSSWYYVTSTDSNGCVTHDSVLVKTKSLPVITGTVGYDSLGTELPIVNGNLMVFYGDTVGQLDTLVLSPYSNGSFFVDSIPAGIIGILSQPDSALYYPAVQPSYFGGAVLWDSLTTYNVGCEDTLYFNHVHTYLVLPDTGWATISGYVFERKEGRREGEPLRGVDITVDGNPGGNIAFRKTDNNGFFSFDRIPNGKYTLLVNIPGKLMDSTYVFDIDANGTSAVFDTTVTFYVNDTLIFIPDSILNPDTSTVTHIKQTFTVANTKAELFPVPAATELNLVIYSEDKKRNPVAVYDAGLRKVNLAVKEEEINSGVKYTFDTSSLPSGSYYLHVVQNGKSYMKKFVKK